MTPHASRVQPTPHRVRRVHRETEDTRTLELAALSGESSASFAAGQFNMLYAFGVGEAPISISGDPTAADGHVHTVRGVGAVSRALCALRPGDTVGVRGPFGAPWPLDAAAGSDILLVAGGVGIAPLRSALCQVLGTREQFGHVTLLYGARAPDELVYRDDLARWAVRDDVTVAVTVDRATPSWTGHVGVVTTLLDDASVHPARCLALLCGPEIMIRVVGAELTRRGVLADRIHVALERNMPCALGVCGRCQLGPELLCRTGPIYPLARVAPLLGVPEL